MLHNDIYPLIAYNLEYKELLRLCRTSKKMYSILYENQQFWKAKFEHENFFFTSKHYQEIYKLYSETIVNSAPEYHCFLSPQLRNFILYSV